MLTKYNILEYSSVHKEIQGNTQGNKRAIRRKWFKFLEL